MQGIAIGVSDFKMLRLKDNYFIDKSLFIYEASLKERGYTNITKMVFAFRGKEVKMEVY